MYFIYNKKRYFFGGIKNETEANDREKYSE